MGLIFAGFGKAAQLQFKLPLKTATRAQPVLLGIVFAVGWTPCIGPTLAVVQTLALTEATATKGALLSISYGIGLGIPFILLSVMAAKSPRIVKQLRQKQQLFIWAGSIFLIVLGLLLLSGLWAELMIWLQQQYSTFVVLL